MAARDQLVDQREALDPLTRELLDAVIALNIQEQTLQLDDDDPDGAGYLVLYAPREAWERYVEARDAA